MCTGILNVPSNWVDFVLAANVSSSLPFPLLSSYFKLVLPNEG